MTNPTSNYGFVLPTATDLVTDLPADFDVALQGVDTRLKALNPETTLGDLSYGSATANTNTRLPIGSAGQVLTVSAGVPSWASPSDQTPLTTKGDLFTFTTVDARLGVGTNGQYLQADSTTATGLKWATLSTTPTFYGCALRNSANTSVADNTETKMPFDTEIFDVGGFHDNVTNNSRITIPTGFAGKYLFTLIGNFGTNASGVRELTLYKNGASYFAQSRSNTPGLAGLTLSFIADAAVADYFQLNMYQTSGSALSSSALFTATYLGV